MKDNIFGHWLKELCSLVFIQTIQAFIFAIVISLIISIMTPENIGNIGQDNRNDYINAVGLIAIIALASVSKLEELVKKIFGVQSNITDTGMRGGMKSLATTMMAANLAKGVLDNAGKVVGGVAGVRSANSSMNKQRARLARKVGGDGSSVNSGSNLSNSTESQNEGSNNLPSSSSVSNLNASRSRNLSTASSGGKRAMSKDLQKAYDDYEDKMQELKEKRRASAFKAISGGTETLGAIGGGITGALIGASVGEGKEIMNGALAGIGIGDKIGAAPTKVAQTALNFSHAIDDTLDQRKSLVKEVNNMNDQARDAIKNKKALTTKYSAARKELDKQLKAFDVSDL